jgi:hypothetical protein
MPRSKWPRKPDDPNTRRFQEACAAWASQSEISLNKVFQIAGKKRGRKMSWAKERYYGGSIPTDYDIAWARLNAINDVLSAEDAVALSGHRRAVAKFCYSCAQTPVNDISATCWDGSCPLRPVSPLPLRISVEKKPIE